MADLGRTDMKTADDSFVPGLRADPDEDSETAQFELLDGRQLSPEEILAEPPDALDIAAELSAPPRRKLPWLTLALCGGVIAALSFAGGAMVEKNNQPAASSGGGAAAARGAAGGGFGGFTRGGAGGAGATGGTGGSGTGSASTVGTVKLVDGSTVYVTDSSGNVVKVTTGGSTKVSIAKDGKVGDLQPGQTVTVRGTTDANGDVAATTVTQGGNPFAGFGGFGGGGGTGG